MRLFPQLLICLATAGVATICIIQFKLSGPIQLGIVIAIATCLPMLFAKSGKSRAADDYSNREDYSDGEDYSDREEGEVKWFNVSKGFGFIRRDNGEEIFVHFRSILGAGKDNSRRSLRDGQRVSYHVVDSDKGPQAEEVQPL